MYEIKIAMSVVLGIALLTVIIFSWSIVSSTQVGLRTTLGDVSDETLDAGLHFKIPFVQSIKKVSIQNVKTSQENVATYSKDGQVILISHALQYRVDKGHVRNLFVDIGMNYQNNFVLPTLEDTLKSEIAKYNAIDVVANRNLLRETIKSRLQERLLSSYIIVTDYNIINEDFDDDYEKAIVAKQVAFEMAKQAENNTKRIEEEKKQAILRSEAEAEQSRLQAEALKYGGDVVIEKIKAEAMLELAKKWQGGVPSSMTILGDGEALPLFNIK